MQQNIRSTLVLQAINRNKGDEMKRSIWTTASAIALFAAFAAHVGTAYATEASVQARLETVDRFDDDAGGNADADDPAIWVHPSDEEDSIVIATLKEGGIDVYDLNGMLLQRVPGGPGLTPDSPNRRFNNVDIVYNFELQGREVDLAVVSNRGTDKLSIFVIDKAAAEARGEPLRDVTAANAPYIFVSSIAELGEERAAQGLAAMNLSDDEEGPFVAFVSRNDRRDVAELRLFAASGGKVSYSIRRRFQLPGSYVLPNGQTWVPCTDENGAEGFAEGMAIDRYNGQLYIAQEKVGLIRTPLASPGSSFRVVDKVRHFGTPYDRVFDEEEEEFVCNFREAEDPGFGGPNLQEDVEGVAIYESEDGKGHVLVSSQGNNIYAVYDRRGNNAFRGTFKVTDGMVDETSETDGMHVSNANFGGQFSSGLIVAHDGENTPEVLDSEGESRDNTNFKFIKWRDVAAKLGLIIDTGSDIRSPDGD